MLSKIPLYVSAAFILVTIAAVAIFLWSVKGSKLYGNRTSQMAMVLIVWLLIQALLAYFGWYSNSPLAMPPKIMLAGIFPAAIAIALAFSSIKGRVFVDSLPLQRLIWINIVRIPVEIVLWLLFLSTAIPQIMTFEGQNFDIFAGLTAPLVAYWYFKKQYMSNKLLLLWNILCLLLLINIVVTAILAAPFPLQQIAFEQPNLALLYFPMCWLPTVVVPIVIFGHLVAIRQLLKAK